MSDPKIAAAGAPTAIVVGDATYYVRPPSDQDMAWLHGELRRLAKRKARSPLAAIAEDLKDLPAEFRAEAVRAAVALKAGGDSEPSQEQIAAQIYTPEAVGRWVWWLARENHPELGPGSVAVTEDNLLDVLAQLAEASGMETTDPNEAGPTGS